MKNLKFLFVLTFFVLGITFSSASTAPGADKNDVKSKIQTLLAHELSGYSTSGDESIKITFTVTSSDEIVVLKTNSTSADLDYKIKSALNYQKLDKKSIDPGVYNVDLTIQEENSQEL